MFKYCGPSGLASILTLGLGAIGLLGVMPAVQAAEFQGGPDDPGQIWENPDNWVGGTLPGAGDAVTTDPGTNALIFDGQNELVLSLESNGSVNVGRGGSLTVTGGITNNGGYFINDGLITGDQTVGPDGYVSNTNHYEGNLDNNGVVYSQNLDGPVAGVLWHGDVTNSGTVTNTHATWEGAITDNTGQIYNSGGGIWTGDVTVHSSGGSINNDTGSSWTGNVIFNGTDDGINNIDGAQWTGNVETNFGSINNNGGIWTGDLQSNDGTVFSTTGSVWNGSMTNGVSGVLVLGGAVNGFVDNSGEFDVNGALSGVTELTNNGIMSMQNGVAGDSVHAQSWSGTGSGILEFSPTLGRADNVVLSGTYSADTQLDIEWIGSDQGRAYGDMRLITAEGGVTGTIDPLLHLPEDGVISYRLVQSADGWTLATLLSEAPDHVASALDLLGRATVSATQIPADRAAACHQGDGWARALGGGQSGHVGGTVAGLGLGGVQVGYDLTCVALPGDAVLGIGMTGGTFGGRLSQDFAGEQLSGTFEQGFAGAYGDLVAGSLRAVLQGQLDFGSLSVSDPQAALDAATLSTMQLNVSGNASYTLAFGGVSLAPEVGFSTSVAKSQSSNFADVGAMSLDSGPTLDAYFGATLSGDIVLPDGATTLTPFATLSLHGDPLSSAAVFTDVAGGSATVSVDNPGSYVALSLGANALHTRSAAGQSLDAGLKADFRLGPQVADGSFGGYAQVKF